MTLRSRFIRALDKGNVSRIKQLLDESSLNYIPESLIWDKMDNEDLVIQLIDMELVKFSSFEQVKVLAPASIVTIVKMKQYLNQK
jgi:hypothetical protein